MNKSLNINLLEKVIDGNSSPLNLTLVRLNLIQARSSETLKLYFNDYSMFLLIL
jgi:hypothetical protein